MVGIITSAHPEITEYDEYDWVSFPYLDGTGRTKDEPLAGEFIPVYEHVLQVGKDPKVQAAAVKRHFKSGSAKVYAAVIDKRWTQENAGKLMDILRAVREVLPETCPLVIRYADDVDVAVAFSTYYIATTLMVGPGWSRIDDDLSPLFAVVMRDEDVEEEPDIFTGPPPLIYYDEGGIEYTYLEIRRKGNQIGFVYERPESPHSE